MKTKSIHRRDFLKILGTAGASLLLGIYLEGCDQTGDGVSGADPTQTPVPEIDLPGGTLEPNIYLRIDGDGMITVTAFRSEMGQGVRTAIAMILAEELDANWDYIRIEQAPADRRYGNQVTGGSASISSSYFDLRMAGAAIRQMLVNAAAVVWDVDPKDLTTTPGYVLHPNGEQNLSYGQLAGTAAELKLPGLGEYALKKDVEFRIIGTNIHHWDAADIITGKAVYGFDVKLPGMLYAALARSPVFDGSIASYDDSKTMMTTGVKSVHEFDNKLAVVAESTWAAIKGRDALVVSWEGGKSDLSSDSIRETLAGRAPQPGSAKEGFLEAFYEFPYQAHVPMEPMNCTADVKAETCEVWAPTQSAQDVHQAVQVALKFSRDNVTVHVPLMGGGFGRRLQTDYAVEAAKVSQAVGAPVQVVWTRADDIQHDFYHPMSFFYASGDPQAGRQPTTKNIDGSSFIPTGAWRSVGNHPDAYIRECFIDELAEARDMDPLDFRREIYNSRALAVVELAAEKSDWGSTLPDSWGRGMAYHATFGVTHVAMVVEIEVTAGVVRVQRVVCAVDCGLAINPDNIAAQMEGGIAFGLTAALKGGVTLEGGRILESNFHDSPILRLDEMPKVEVYHIQGTDKPSGIGEMGVPPVAPAVANAVFNATGVRVRHLPIKAEDLT
jgi:isoquinoline 1-oxidoreductase beta subunit